MVRGILAVAFLLALTAGPARALQSETVAKRMLIQGPWYLEGVRRQFNADGTWTSFGNRAIGTWLIQNETLTIDFDGGQVEMNFPMPINASGTSGQDNKGRPVVLTENNGPQTTATPFNRQAFNRPQQPTPLPTPAIAAAAPPQVTPGLQATASGIIQAHHDSLVFVTGSAGAGSGFIVKVGSGGNFLITNVHVTAEIRDAAFKTFDGDPVKTGIPSMAVGEDIFCMAMPDGGTPFEIMENVGQNAAVGDDVVVLGNAEGGGVINTITGKIVGIGPNLVEVDAPFVPGNSGSPIVHLKTGKVIGVATYTITNQYDLTTNKKLPEPKVRRFGYRLDSVKGWQPVHWPSFYAQAMEMERVESLTDDLYNFIKDMAENKGKVFESAGTNPVIKEQIDRWIEEKGSHPSAEDAAEADSRFISTLKLTCNQGLQQAQQQITYDYFRRNLNDQIQGRNELAGDFQEIIRDIGQ